MPIAQGARHGLAYVAESTYGVTPGSPSMKQLRYVSTSINLTKDSYTSEEIREDRMVADMRHGTRQVGGEVGIEAIFGAHDDLLEGAMFGNWTSNVLKAGTARKSFTIERRFNDISRFQRFTGMMVNQWSLSVPASGMVTGSFEFIGKGYSSANTQLGAPAAAVANSPLDSALGALKEGGTTFGMVTAFEISVDNGIDPTFVVGSNEAADVSYGRSNITGSVSALLTDLALFDKFANEAESSLELTLSDPIGNSFVITVPRLKYSGGDSPVSGEGNIALSMPFTALYDSVSGTNLYITRTAA